METIKTEWEGIELVGEILSHNEWAYTVRLIEPYESWEGTSHIPTFARGTTNNYIGEYGQQSIKNTLVSLYKKSERFYGELPDLKSYYKNYLEEMEAIRDFPFGIHWRMEMKLTHWFMDRIFGHGDWTMDEIAGVMKILKDTYK